MQLRQRLNLQAAHLEYLEVKARKDEAMKEEEAEFQRQMMQKFAEDDRIEQMNAQKRRMKQLGKGLSCIQMVSVVVVGWSKHAFCSAHGLRLGIWQSVDLILNDNILV